MYIGPDFVFIAVPRTASTTMTTVFLPQFGGGNMGEYHACKVPEGYSRRFTFAVVRNPYDRMLSCWYHLRRNDTKFNIRNMSFPEFMHLLAATWGPDGRSQAEFLSHSRIDRTLQYEKLQAEVLMLPFNRKRLGWPRKRCNAETRAPWKFEMQRHPEWARIIEEHSAPDFERYGYSKWL